MMLWFFTKTVSMMQLNEDPLHNILMKEREKLYLKIFVLYRDVFVQSGHLRQVCHVEARDELTHPIDVH